MDKKSASDNGGTITFERLSELQKKKLAWLWPNHFALRKLALLTGNPDQGKSLISIDAAARVTTGADWPDGALGTGKPKSVVFITDEDEAEDTIVPRLEYAGGATSKILIIRGQAFESDDATTVNSNGEEVTVPGQKRFLNLITDIGALRRGLKSLADVALVVIDPITAYLPGVNTDRDAEVRNALAPLQDLAREFPISILMVMHNNKSVGQNAIHRASGSVAFTALPRTGFTVMPDPRDTTDGHLFLPLKTNIMGAKGKGRRYKIVGPNVNDVRAKIVWGEQVDIRPDDAQMALLKQRATYDGGVKQKTAEDFIRAFLSDGPKTSVDLEKATTEVTGIKGSTFVRAKQRVGLKAVKLGMNEGWALALADRRTAPAAVPAPSMSRNGREPKFTQREAFAYQNHLRGVKQAMAKATKKIDPQLQKIRAWRVEDARIADDKVLEVAKIVPPAQADFLKQCLAVGPVGASVYFVTIYHKSFWCAFVGGFVVNKAMQLTPTGSMTLNALMHLPGVAENAPFVLSPIANADRFRPVVLATLSAAADRSRICFFGDMAHELDCMDEELLQPLGSVKAAVELNAAGWPQEWKPRSLRR